MAKRVYVAAADIDALLKLKAWHLEQEQAATTRFNAAATIECAEANREAIAIHGRAYLLLLKIIPELQRGL